MPKEKKSFKLYFDQYEPTRNLPDECKARLWDAVFQYNMGEEVKFDDPVLEALFGFFRQHFQWNDEAYAAICERNDKNGQKGGRPKKTEENPEKPKITQNNPVEPKRNPSEPKKPDNDIDIDIVIKEIRNNKTSSHPVPGGEPEEPAVFALPTNKGEEYPIRRSDVDRWRSIYPAVNVEQEIRNMIGWCEGHKSQRKTWGGMVKFITGWLAREQDRGPTLRASPPSSTAPRWNQPVN